MIEINRKFKKGIGVGKHCLFDRSTKVIDGNKAIKVFYDSPSGWWGDHPKKGGKKKNTKLSDATAIQNIMSWYGLAPRVWDLFKVKFNGKICDAQLTDDIGDPQPTDGLNKKHDRAIEVMLKCKKICEQFGFVLHDQDVNDRDEINGMLVDFQGFSFGEETKKKICDFYTDKTKWGSKYYQRIPELGLYGSPRQFDKRVKSFKLNEIDFKNKTVLDLGCSGGDFLKYAYDKGAKKTVGIDLDNVAEGAFVMAQYQGYYGIDFIPRELKNSINSITGKFDIVFYNSMIRHVGLPDWLLDVTSQLLIIEWNNGVTSQQLEDWIKRRFKKSEMVGRSTDHGNKPVWWCYVS